MMQKILVEVDYYDFYFDCMAEAVEFAETAASHITGEDRNVALSVKFIKEEVENGED